MVIISELSLLSMAFYNNNYCYLEGVALST